MANFCSQCRQPIDQCICDQKVETMYPNQANNVKSQWVNFKNRVGIGEPEYNATSPYEENLKIVPECVKPNDGEIPIKQYTIAKLRNRGVWGISISQALGRIQVTNKRVIFRASGKWYTGRTVLQHEYDINEISGVEARREFIFNIWDFINAFSVFGLGFIIAFLILNLPETEFGLGVLGLFFTIVGSLPFFMLQKKWLLKIFLLGFANAGCFANSLIASKNDIMSASGESSFGEYFFTFIYVVVAILTIFSFTIYIIKPNLLLIIKTKGASTAVDIRAKRTEGIKKLFGIRSENEHTGYSEILPLDECESCIRELWAIISDVQNLGDFAIEKWKID